LRITRIQARHTIDKQIMTVKIVCKNAPGQVEILIEDDGPGIPADLGEKK